MVNAKEELLNLINSPHLKSKLIIKCAIVSTQYLGESWGMGGSYGWVKNEEEDKSAKLKVGYSEEDYDKFFSDLDFEYDNGFGYQVLYGTIWFEDGTWAERHDYDGSEWWVIRKLPAVPNILIEVREQ